MAHGGVPARSAKVREQTKAREKEGEGLATSPKRRETRQGLDSARTAASCGFHGGGSVELDGEIANAASLETRAKRRCRGGLGPL